MKKVVLLLLAALMCLSFVACGEEDLLITDDDGLIMINVNRFGECIDEVVELTTENWDDYFKVVSYTEEIIYEDPFGETYTKSVDDLVLGIQTEKYYSFENAVVEVKNTNTEEISIFHFDGEGEWSLYHNSIGVQYPIQPDDFDLKDFECTRIKGRIYFFDLPHEAVSFQEEQHRNAGRHMVKVFYLKDENGKTKCEINPYTKEIYHIGTGNWQE